MSAAGVSAAVARLNAGNFHGRISVEYAEFPASETYAWGRHVWIINYVSGGETYAERLFFLTSSRAFEIRHGGGSNFAWWIDASITNAVALTYDGVISDDAGAGKWKGVEGKYQRFRDYLASALAHVARREILDRLVDFELEQTPPEFHGEVRAFSEEWGGRKAKT